MIRADKLICLPIPSEAIVLDLEYSTFNDGYIFLAGMLVVGNDGLNSMVQEFAEDSQDEQRILETIIRVLMEYPAHPIVT